MVRRDSMSLIEQYMEQAGECYSFANHYAHINGTTHTNNSGSHADTSQLSGGGHGDHVDSSDNF